MKAQETTFQKVIEGQRQFQIPLYQRTYSWQEKELGKLWEDILEQANALQNGAAGSSHFLGSVVLAPSPVTDPPGVDRWVVVDGQQRLTTLMLALCALRDHSAVEEPQARDRINELYLTNKWNSGMDHYRLLPTQADRPAFFACVGETPEAGGGDNIGACYRFFREVLANADNPSNPYDLNLIETVLLQRLAIVEITTDLEDNVYRIFESLNNTGRRLTQADLLRNYVFMRLGARSDEIYAEYWLPMQKRLGEHLETLFFLDLVLRGNERAKRTDIYGAQRARLDKLVDEGAIEREIAVLERHSRIMRRIVDPTHEPHPGIRAALKRLNTWGAQTTYPLVLHLLVVNEDGGATASEVEQALGYVESFLVRRMICNVPTNNLNRIFNTIVGQLPDAPIADAVRRVLSGQRRFWPTAREVRGAIKSKPFFWQGRQEQKLLILGRLEGRIAGDGVAGLVDRKLKIEHVIPEQRVPLRHGDEGSSETLLSRISASGQIYMSRELLHTLGNLTLVELDMEMSNHLDERRRQFVESDLAINREIAGGPQWDSSTIHSTINLRADRIADLVADIWPGPLAEDAAKTSNWDLLHRALAALPEGSWTTYEDLAALVGLQAAPVGAHLATVPRLENVERVLGRDGRVGSDSHWMPDDSPYSPQDILRNQGMRFGDRLVADPAQRISSQGLACLLGISGNEQGGEPPFEISNVDGRSTLTSGWSASFLRQLEEQQSSPVQDGVQQLLAFWQQLGETYLQFGSAQETSCSLMLRGPEAASYVYWPFVLYPSGTITVEYKYLRQRPPFDLDFMWAEFRRRCSEAPGVDIPRTKVPPRPRFPLEVLADPESRECLFAALEWFAVTARSWVSRHG